MRRRHGFFSVLGGLIAAAELTLGLARAQQPPGFTIDLPPRAGDSLSDRLNKLEAINREIMNRLDHAEHERKSSDERYRALERKYETLRKQVETEPKLPEAIPTQPEVEGKDREKVEPEDLIRLPEEGAWPLRATFNEGFSLKSPDDEYELRLRILDQTDFKVFVPGDQFPARSGLYIPRVRVYFEGQLTRLFEYEVSIQRSVEGVWDLLDGNVNIRPDERFQMRFGRTLVPYSYDWYDHLEQFFITPERSLFPLNFGLSRSAGLMAHGRLFDERLQYAVGGFDGHLTGVADDNTTRDAVGYFNFKPFLQSERFPLLRDFNIGASGFLGQQVSPVEPFPLRTSLQSSENDEAARAATSIFLEFEDGVAAFGGRSATALHLAWYGAGFSFEAEWQGGRGHFIRPELKAPVSVPVSGNHFTLAYFLTGEQVRDRSIVTPLRPFDPTQHSWGPGAIELFARFSQLTLGDTVFTAGLANPNEWTRSTDLIDVGLNWYLTRYIKIYLDWQHSSYASPVLLNPFKDLFGRSNDLFWIRGQLYY